MIRKVSNKPGQHRRSIKWRGHEILRIEAFSDAVFAFAMTLLVISLEVPKSFNELMEGMYGMIGFAICFCFLFLIWHEQYIFFRMYFLKDTYTIFLNAVLLFTVLFYVYPLKFLFTLLTEGNRYSEHGQVHLKINSMYEVQTLMIVYGIGFCLVYFVIGMLYLHAWKKREEIKLTDIERFNTKTEIYKQLVMFSVGAVAVVASLMLPSNYSGEVGMFYAIIGPALGIFFSIRGKMLRKQFTVEELKNHDEWVRQ